MVTVGIGISFPLAASLLTSVWAGQDRSWRARQKAKLVVRGDLRGSGDLKDKGDRCRRSRGGRLVGGPCREQGKAVAQVRATVQVTVEPGEE